MADPSARRPPKVEVILDPGTAPPPRRPPPRLDARPRVGGLALLASFSVYLLPILTDQATWLLGQALVFEFIGRGHKDWLWRLADLLLALVLQAMAFGLLVWVLRKPKPRRLVTLPVAAVLAFMALQWLYLAVIPSRFLVEAETAREHVKWADECAVPGYALMAGSAARAVSAGAAADDLWVTDALGRPARLRVPGCAVTPTSAPFGGDEAVLAATASGGRYLYSQEDRKSGQQAWWYGRPGLAAQRLGSPAGYEPGDGPPVLSSDGDWIAWLVRGLDSGQPRPSAVVLRPLRAGEEMTVRLDGLPRGRFRLIAVDMLARELTLGIDERYFVGVNLDGATRWGPLRPPGVDPVASTFRRVADGWVAWDGSREGESYRLAWILGGAEGRHRVRRGRTITSLAAHPSGTMIALSVTAALPIADVPDAVYVFRTDGGSEVFRRYLPAFTRSEVMFAGRALFAYTHSHGPPEVRVLRISD